MKRLNRTARNFTLVLLLFLLTISAAAPTKNKQRKIASFIPSRTWPDKLDAVVASPKNHQVVFEDSNVRVLQVICPPGNEEPVHTHRYKSTMWLTKSACFIYYNYVAGKNGQLAKKDSVEVMGFPNEALNKGQLVDREGPHSVKNISTDTLMAYRIEYKNDFK